MTTIYEGFIEPDSAPQAYALIESWNAKMKELNDQPSIEFSAAFDALQKQQQEVMVAIARIERAVNFGAGKVVTHQ